MPAKKAKPKTTRAKKPVPAKAVAGKSAASRKAAPAVARPAHKAKAAAPQKTHPKHRPVPAPHATPSEKPRPVKPAPKLADTETGDNALLTGPRNVQPYTPKRGEQYMSREQLDHFRKILQSWKQDLMEEVDRTVSHMKDEAANFPDPNDRATQEEEFSLELRTRDRERKLIRKIDEALNRVEDGSYGYCLETGEPIGIKRLEARPVATLSIEAQERRERREKQYGDRDDRYR